MRKRLIKSNQIIIGIILIISACSSKEECAANRLIKEKKLNKNIAICSVNPNRVMLGSLLKDVKRVYGTNFSLREECPFLGAEISPCGDGCFTSTFEKNKLYTIETFIFRDSIMINHLLTVTGVTTDGFRNYLTEIDCNLGLFEFNNDTTFLFINKEKGYRVRTSFKKIIAPNYQLDILYKYEIDNLNID